MVRSARRRLGGRQAARSGRKPASGTDRATRVMTAVRLGLTIWELARDATRDNWPGGGPGRLL